ncbi:MAG: M18 family aminopeptidase [Rectinemataceae bacterium]
MTESSFSSSSDAATRALCDFIDASPTAFHAADNLSAALQARGAVELSETETWNLEPGAAYFVRRGGSALIAFRPGLRSAGESGFVLAGAHTDSPGLKLRLEKALASRNLIRSPVEVYGGAILSGWLDRPLGLAGRIAMKGRNGVEVRLYSSGNAVGIIPNLAIHLNREVNKGFEYNPHIHMPVLVDALDPDAAKSGTGSEHSWALDFAASSLGMDPDGILGADLYFFEPQKAIVLGSANLSNGAAGNGPVRGGIVNGPRLDDLAGCQAVAEAFIASAATEHGQVACFLDAEEVGSMTAQGADSSFLRDVLARICIASGAAAQDFYRALARSFCISVDAAQAWHPAFPEKFDERYAPLLNAGPAVKAGANWRYATDAIAEARFRTACTASGVRCQKYMSRPDIAPGSTIGPITSAHLGVKTVDIGHPMLSMHAVRETIGAHDHADMIAVIAASYARSPEV